MKKKLFVLISLVLVASFLAACYGPKNTEEDQALVETKFGNIEKVEIGGGQHYSTTYGKEGVVIGLGVRQVEVSTRGEADCVNADNPAQCARNGRAWTGDPQPIIVTVVVYYRIQPTETAIRFLWENHKSWIEDRSRLDEAVEAFVVEQIKEVTVRYTLLDLIGITGGAASQEETDGVQRGRELFASSVKEELQSELDPYYLEVTQVSIKNVDPADNEYEEILNDASAAEARAAAIERELDTVRKQQEKAAIENDIARDRAQADADVRKINAAVYEDEATYQLEMARIWASAMSSGTIFFMPSDQVANLFMQGMGTQPPVVVPAAPAQ